jgi:glycerophosphoryl diester phosphodiesterase
MPMPHPFFEIPIPIVLGHRGAAGEMPENTLASFERGLADGATTIETDVHLTHDGVPVLIHDDDVARNTEGGGRVAGLTFEALRRLDAGYRFSPDGGRSHPQRGRDLRVPSLAEALDAFPGVRFNLELKEDLPGLVEQTIEVIGVANRASLSLVTAADDALMARLRRHAAAEGVDVALGACVGEVAGFARAAVRGEAPPAGPMALQIPPDFGGRPLVTAALIEHAHRHGVQVHVWTINEPDEIRALLDLGVDGIVSDFPARVVAIAQSRR